MRGITAAAGEPSVVDVARPRGGVDAALVDVAARVDVARASLEADERAVMAVALSFLGTYAAFAANMPGAGAGFVLLSLQTSVSTSPPLVVRPTARALRTAFRAVGGAREALCDHADVIVAMAAIFYTALGFRTATHAAASVAIASLLDTPRRAWAAPVAAGYALWTMAG